MNPGAYYCPAQRSKGRSDDEADVPAEPPAPREDTRLPRADEDPGRAEGLEAAAQQGAQTTDGLTGRFSRRERLTSGADFQALFQQGKRIDRPALIVLWRAVEAPRRVGFAVSRQVRGAAQRNRARRRLREAYRAARGSAPQRTALVIIGRPAVLDVEFKVLVTDLGHALRSIPLAKRSA